MPSSQPEDQKAVELISRLTSANRRAAWAEFLREYSPLILQVIGVFEKDPDLAGDCFVFVCEQISRSRFARLRKYSSDRAGFVTWLRAVVRNLVVDFHRREFGRQRVFESVSKMSAVDQEIFRSVFEKNLSEDETVALLKASYAGLDKEAVSAAVGRIAAVLTPRQRWLLASKNPVLHSTGEGPPEPDTVQLRHPSPNPEDLTVTRDLEAKLRDALRRLPPAQRVLIRLRYEQELSLAACAEVSGLENAQKADRQIRSILERLKNMIEN